MESIFMSVIEMSFVNGLMLYPQKLGTKQRQLMEMTSQDMDMVMKYSLFNFCLLNSAAL